MASVALVDEANMFWLRLNQAGGIGNGLRCHMRVHAAIRAIEPDAVVFAAHHSLCSVQLYRHRSILLLIILYERAPARDHRGLGTARTKSVCIKDLASSPALYIILN